MGGEHENQTNTRTINKTKPGEKRKHKLSRPKVRQTRRLYIYRGTFVPVAFTSAITCAKKLARFFLWGRPGSSFMSGFNQHCIMRSRRKFIHIREAYIPSRRVDDPLHHELVPGLEQVQLQSLARIHRHVVCDRQPMHSSRSSSSSAVPRRGA